MLSFQNPKCKDVGGGNAEKQDYNDVYETIIKKLGDCKGTQIEDGRLSVLIVEIYNRTTMKAAKVLVCSEGVLENLSLT